MRLLKMIVVLKDYKGKSCARVCVCVCSYAFACAHKCPTLGEHVLLSLMF